MLYAGNWEKVSISDIISGSEDYCSYKNVKLKWYTCILV